MTNPNIIQKSILPLFCLLLVTFNSFGQKLLNSRQTSYYTYIYKISNEEALTIMKGHKFNEPNYLHTLVDSFLTDSTYKKTLPKGHYLKTYSEGSQQKIAYATVQDFNIFILNNNTDLTIQVFDLNGNIIPDAVLKVKGKQLKYDPKLKAYNKKKNNKDGLLSVSYKGFTGYYQFNRQWNNGWIVRAASSVAWSKPLRYVWIPIRFAGSLPVQGIKSIKNHRPEPNIYRTGNFFSGLWGKIACIFDKSHCSDQSDWRFEGKHKGYLVFDKPKYKPGDTVKLKAIILKKNGKPVKKSVKVVLHSWKKDYRLTTLKPYRDGAYEYRFVLSDSLKLDLDNDYSIYLNKNDRQKYIDNDFRYEEYKLSGLSLTIKPDSSVQLFGHPFKIQMTGKDENDLMLQGARTEILVKAQLIKDFLKPNLFIPDTLLFIKKDLAPDQPTKISIPDSIFPETNLEYQFEVRLITSDNQVKEESSTITFYRIHKAIETQVSTDSLFIKMRENGELIKDSVKILAGDNFGNKEFVFSGETPVKIPINRYFSRYYVQSSREEKVIELNRYPSLLIFHSNRTADSLFISIKNPRKIPFLYSIFRANKLILEGNADTLDYKIRETSKKNYQIYLRYLWGGRVKEEAYSLNLRDRDLNITAIQPQLVFPGQTKEIKLLVTDYKGKPVKDVDLTAFGLTQKFNYTPSKIPRFPKRRKDKRFINSFKLSKSYPNIETNSYPLDYPHWISSSGLDSIEYYKFIYPGSRFYKTTYFTKDSITQFSPYIFSNGENVPIYVIYLNNQPVYFGGLTTLQPYSFKVDSGYAEVRIRTKKNIFTIKKIYFENGKRSIFSFDQNHLPDGVSVSPAEPKLSQNEINRIYPYILPIERGYGKNDPPTYIEHDGAITSLRVNQGKYVNGLQFTGPFMGSARFHSTGNFSINFQTQPRYLYSFKPGLLKLTSISLSTYPFNLNWIYPNPGLKDTVIGVPALQKEWIKEVDSFRRNSGLPCPQYIRDTAIGKLYFSLKNEDSVDYGKPTDVFLFSEDGEGWLRILPGKNRLAENLPPAYYRLLIIFPNERYASFDSIQVRANGMNYCELTLPRELTHDAFSLNLDSVITAFFLNPNHFNSGEGKFLYTLINNLTQSSFLLKENRMTIRGRITDSKGVPIGYTRIRMEGSNQFVFSNSEGVYSFIVPKGKQTLIYEADHYDTKVQTVQGTATINISLPEDLKGNKFTVNQLGQVSITKEKYVGAADNVSSLKYSGVAVTGYHYDLANALEGAAPGIMIEHDGAGGKQLRIRGMGSISSGQAPLIVINGEIFTGDLSSLDPNLIKSATVLKDASATALYGARAQNGVIILNMGAGSNDGNANGLSNKGADFDQSFLQEAGSSRDIRKHFADVAFWQPKLKTNEDGIATFKVTFPADVTNWQTHVLAVGKKGKTGQISGGIKSYKPLMAQLSIPDFLIAGDEALVLGKTLNYTQDSPLVTTRFRINNIAIESKKRQLHNSFLDTFKIQAKGDSVLLGFTMDAPNDYFDGEQKEISILPKGLSKMKGQFLVLEKDTELTLNFDPALGTIEFDAATNSPEFFQKAIDRLIQYPYDCNEQLASKLIGYLGEKQLMEYEGRTFKHNRQVQKLVRRLSNNQNENGLWGWWDKSNASYWITDHVLFALQLAKEQGFSSSLSFYITGISLNTRINQTTDPEIQLPVLRTMSNLKMNEKVKNNLTGLKTQDLTFNGLLNLILIRQQLGLKVNLDTLKHFQKETILGNLYYSDTNRLYQLNNNDLDNTLLAYKILRKDSTTNPQLLTKIQNYFLEQGDKGDWQNTYQSSQIIATLLPDFLKDTTRRKNPVLEVKSTSDTVFKEFPVKINLQPNPIITLKKTGTEPVYISAGQRGWDTLAQSNSAYFQIQTQFTKQKDSFINLEAGQNTELIIRMEVKKEAQYVMINVPIPAGCDYSSKPNNFSNEIHREYFKDRTTIFCEHLTPGNYTFKIPLIARFAGIYTLNPVKAELMYFPVLNGNNGMSKVRIK